MDSMVNTKLIFSQIQSFLLRKSNQNKEGMNGNYKNPLTPLLAPKNTNSLSKNYTISGKPCSMTHARDLAFKGWNAQKSAATSCETQLLEQHKEEPLFTGMLHIDVIFYFQPTAAYKKDSLRGKLCKEGPKLDGLIKFIEKVCSRIICSEDAEIVSVAAKKIYDDKPHTELSISRY